MVLNAYLTLLEQESEFDKRIKQAQKDLDAKVAAKYHTLTEEEGRKLVVEDKWLAALRKDIDDEVEKVSQYLTWRVKELAKRYDTPLPKLEEGVEILKTQVKEHLKKMGFEW